MYTLGTKMQLIDHTFAFIMLVTLLFRYRYIGIKLLPLMVAYIILINDNKIKQVLKVALVLNFK